MALTPAPFRGRAGNCARALIPLGILALCLHFLHDAVQGIDMETVRAHWQATAPWQWGLGLCITALSFLAISQYDVIAHRHFNTGLHPSKAARSGLVAVALSQTLGIGVMTAALVRWRMLRGFGLALAVSVTAFTSAIFVMALMAIAALSALLLPAPPGFQLAAGLVLFAKGLLLLAALRRPRISIAGRQMRLPTLPACGQATIWAALDIVAAATVLWVLFPNGTAPAFSTFLPVFTFSLLAGLLAGTPGGLGPFELVILTLTAPGMPAAAPPEAVLVAVAAYRIIFFLLPTLLALPALLITFSRSETIRSYTLPDLAEAPRAETAVIRQTNGTLDHVGSSVAALWPTRQALVALSEPFSPPTDTFFQALAARARSRNRVALIYKCGARSAVAARRAGWVPVLMRREALIDPQTFSTKDPVRHPLRHKLRQETQTGLDWHLADDTDLPDLAGINAAWQRRGGFADQGSLGRFCPENLLYQTVLIATRNGRPVAFLSAHQGAHEWALDLMRWRPDCPDGTMYMLVFALIETARRAGIGQLTLGSVPPNPRWPGRMLQHILRRNSTDPHQFLAAFRPRWSPVYMAAPNRMSLALAAIDIALEIRHPPEAPEAPVRNVNANHKDDENYEVDSSAVA